MRRMLEEGQERKEHQTGLVSGQLDLESNSYLAEEESRRSELVKQIKEGAFEKP